MRLTTLVLSALLFAATASSASDDLTVVSKNTRNGAPSDPTTSYIASDHVRMDVGDGHETIMDLKTFTTTMLDTRKKTYYTTTKADLDEYAAKMKEKMNDPEMKKGMEMMQGMAKGMASEIEVKKTGQTRDVAGFHCEEWSIKMNQYTTMKECVTSKLQYPVKAYEAFKEYGQSMSKAMSGSFGGMAKSGNDMAEKMKAIKGYPVASSMAMDIMGNKTTTESEVTEVRHSSIPASTWEVPADYTKVENPMMKAFDPHGHPPRSH